MTRLPVLSLCLVTSGLAAAAVLCAALAEAQTLNNAFGGLSESSNEPIDVKSDALTVYTDDYVLFTGNVKAVQGTTTLRARELKVHYRGGDNGDAAATESPKQPTVGGGAVSPPTGGSVVPTTASSPEPAKPKADEAAPASAPKPSAEAASEDKTQSSIEDPIDIESDWLLVHDKEKYAHFKGNVRVVRGDTKLRSEELKVDYAGGDSLATTTEASAGAPAQITKIVARGSVHALLGPRASKDSKTTKRPPGTALETTGARALTSGGGKRDAASAGSKVADARPRSTTVSASVPRMAGPRSQASADTNKGPAASQDTPPATSKEREITRLEATGDVVIVSEKDETSTSDWAIYNLPSQLVTIGGNVVLSQGQSVLKGDRLVIDLRTGESRFENTGTATSGGRRIRALFLPKDDAKPGAKPNTPVGGRGNGSAGDQRTPDEPVIDNGEPLPIVPEYR